MAAERTVRVNGIDLRVVEDGAGPLVVLCHGFPELSYSWRHQLPALAAAGYRAIAPDMRGYGGTDRPAAIDQYTMPHLVGDIVDGWQLKRRWYWTEGQNQVVAQILRKVDQGTAVAVAAASLRQIHRPPVTRKSGTSNASLPCRPLLTRYPSSRC